MFHIAAKYPIVGGSNAQDFLSENDGSRLTGVPRKTLQHWRLAGNSFAPQFIKLGKRVYYRRADIERWIEDQPAFQSATQAKQLSS